MRHLDRQAPSPIHTTRARLAVDEAAKPATAIGAEAFQFQPIVPSEPVAFCTHCGSTDVEDVTTGDQGYSACCNEPVEFGTAPKKPAATKKPAVRETNICDGCGKARELFHHDATGLAVCTACEQRYAKTESFQPRVTSSHADCGHPSTKSARAICRRDRAKLAAEAAAKPASRKAKAAS